MKFLTPPILSICWQRMKKKVSQKSRVEFAKKVKAWRKRKGFSQSEAARHLNMSVDTLQNWEIARTKPTGFAEQTLLEIFNKK